MGRKYFKIVVQSHQEAIFQRPLEHLGFWYPTKINPHCRSLILNKYRLRYWISVGALTSGKVQHFLNLYGITCAPWIRFGRKTLYRNRKEVGEDIMHGANNYFEKTVMTPQAQYVFNSLREANEESLYFRKLKFKDRLNEYIEAENPEDQVAFILGQVELPDNTLERTEQFHVVKRKYDEVEAIEPHLSPIKKELLHKKMNDLMNRGIMTDEEYSATKQHESKYGLSTESLMRNRLKMRQEQARKVFLELCEMANPIEQKRFEELLIDRGIDAKNAKDVTEQIFRENKELNVETTYIDLEKIIIAMERSDVAGFPKLVHPIYNIKEEFKGILPRETPTTPRPNLDEYDPEDWHDDLETTSSPIFGTHRPGEKWFDTPLHNERVKESDNKDVLLNMDLFQAKARQSQKRGFYDDFFGLSFNFYTTKNYRKL